jgi:N-acetyl sugar amidotransferase
MDTTDPNITFDEKGNCNHCNQWFEIWENIIDKRPIDEVLAEIRARSTGKYDAIVGISGGIDSGMVAYLAKKHGLNVLLLHVDDGWNTDEAKHNVKTIVEKTGFDFEHIHVDEEEFGDIILSYYKAGVQGLEAVTDHLIVATVHNVMDKYGIKTILSGGNWATEGIMPAAWVYTQHDDKNIRSIHKKYGTLPLKNTKFLGILTKTWRLTRGGIKSYRLLNHIDYHRENTIKKLQNEWGWAHYGRKHQENVYTRFVEAYIFPRRFGFDFRLAYYSPLICSGQASRDEILATLKDPPFTEEEIAREKDLFLEGMKITENQFEEFMTMPIQSHDEFATHSRDLKLIGLMRKLLRR